MPAVSDTHKSAVAKPISHFSVSELQAEEPRLYGRLRFSQILEQAFEKEPDETARRGRRIVLLVPALLMLAAPLYGRELFDTPASVLAIYRLLELGLIAPACLIALWVISKSRSPRVVDWALIAGCAVCSIGLIAMSLVGTAVGHDHPAMLSVIYLSAVFVIARPKFLRWTPVAAAVAMVLVVGQTMIQPAPADLAIQMVLQLTLLLIMCYASYLLELSKRQAWLKLRMLEAVARTDPLTGVLNRRGFDECFEDIYYKAAKQGQSIGLILVDLDYFKPLNDLYGHDYGDACLQAVGQMLRQFTADHIDLAARFGGEEFVLCLCDQSDQETRASCEQLLEDLRLLNIQNKGSKILDRVTASIGAVSFTPKPEVRWPAVIRRADALLYEAKHGGRNCYRFEAL